MNGAYAPPLTAPHAFADEQSRGGQQGVLPPLKCFKEGDPDAIDTVLSHYAGYIRYFSKVHGQVNAEVEEYVKQQLIAALFKFRFDR